MKKSKLGLYAGSFDPFHVGHWDIVNQAQNIFDNILIAKGSNPEKNNEYRYPLPYKLFIKYDLCYTTFSTLLVDLVREMEKSWGVVTLIRGLRNGADLEYEQNISAFLKDMYPTVKIVAFYCDPKYRHISSSALRSIEKIAPDEFKKYAIID
jgi:pantetheine-phosphate adenylyltransferase